MKNSISKSKSINHESKRILQIIDSCTKSGHIFTTVKMIDLFDKKWKYLIGDEVTNLLRFSLRDKAKQLKLEEEVYI